MIDKAAKATRQQVRRAFGPDAVEVLGSTVESLNALTESVLELSRRLSALECLCEARAERHAEVDRSVLTRLRWLLGV